VRPFDI